MPMSLKKPKESGKENNCSIKKYKKKLNLVKEYTSKFMDQVANLRNPIKHRIIAFETWMAKLHNNKPKKEN
jgi:hypothetical protein